MTMPPSAPRYPRQAAIEAYGNGGFRFAGMSHKGSILCLPSSICAWPVLTLSEVTPDTLKVLAEERSRFAFLVIGAGSQAGVLPDQAAQYLLEAKIAYDVMDTGAAARTYNILLAEQRAVAAALIAVQ